MSIIGIVLILALVIVALVAAMVGVVAGVLSKVGGAATPVALIHGGAAFAGTIALAMAVLTFVVLVLRS